MPGSAAFPPPRFLQPQGCSQQVIPVLACIPKLAPPQFTPSSTVSQALCICLGLPTTHVQSVGWEIQLQGACVALTPV